MLDQKKKEMKRIRNITGVPQSVVYKGKQVILHKSEEKLMDLGLANMFLEMCPGTVIEITDNIGGVAKEKTPTNQVWIANMTGNPDGPDTIIKKEFKDKQWREISVPNPLKEPMNLREQAEGPMKEYVAKDGALEALNMAAVWYEIPPYTRKPFDEATADWFLNRCGGSTPRTVRGAHVEKAIKSRAPSNFEPDSSWSLNELIAYLKLVDPDSASCRSEMTIRDKMKKGKKTEDEIEMEINDEKVLVLKRIHFRLCDPKYRLPTRALFEEFFHGKPQEEESTDVSKAEAIADKLAGLTEQAASAE